MRPGARASELDIWWRIAWLIVAPAGRLMFRLRLVGAERIPAEGPAILAANHVSFLDGPMLCIAPVERRRIVRFLVAVEYFRGAVTGWCLRRCRQIPIRRGEGDAHALDETIRLIRAGALAGIFPEGHVNPGDPSTLQRVRRGAARISLAARAPVIPVGIWGTQVRWPRSGIRYGRPWRPALTFAFGEPIEAEGDADVPEDVAAFTERVAEGLARAVGDARADADARG